MLVRLLSFQLCPFSSRKVLINPLYLFSTLMLHEREVLKTRIALNPAARPCRELSTALPLQRTQVSLPARFACACTTSARPSSAFPVTKWSAQPIRLVFSWCMWQVLCSVASVQCFEALIVCGFLTWNMRLYRSTFSHEEYSELAAVLVSSLKRNVLSPGTQYCSMPGPTRKNYLHGQL